MTVASTSSPTPQLRASQRLAPGSCSRPYPLEPDCGFQGVRSQPKHAENQQYLGEHYQEDSQEGSRQDSRRLLCSTRRWQYSKALSRRRSLGGSSCPALPVVEAMDVTVLSFPALSSAQ